MFQKLKPILFIIGVSILAAYLVNRISFIRNVVMTDKTWI
jgi:hypothetical protein